jgi:hypothetical protein
MSDPRTRSSAEAPTPTSPAPASPAEWARVVVLALGLVAILTYPTVPGFAHMGRLETSDGRFSIWNIGWIDHALLTDPRHLLDANIFSPHTGTLAYSELNLVAGVIGLPVYAITKNAIAAHNFAVVMALVLSVVCMWALVRRLTGSSGAGEVAATAFTFCPFVQSHTAHIQLLMVFTIPLTFLAFDRLRERPSIARGLALGLAVTVMGLACAYYGVYGGVALGVVALLSARWGRRYWIAMGVALVVAAALTMTVLVPYRHAREASGAAHALSVGDTSGYSATAADWLTSPTRAHGWLNQNAAECAFPGFIALGLAALGVLAARRGDRDRRRITLVFLAIAALAIWASFGSRAGLYEIVSVVPGAALLRAPVRLAIVAMFGIAVVAGFGVARLSSGRRWVAPVLVAGLVLELAAVPWPLRAAEPVPQAYDLLARLPRGVVVEYLFNYKSSDYHNQTHAMFNSTYHWQPLVNGYSDLIPSDFDAFAVPINAFPDPASFELLHRLQVRYVVVHLRDYQGEARDRLLARFPPYEANLRRLTTDQDVWLYEIVSWPSPGGRP